MPLARLMLEIGERRIWLTAAIVEKPPQDILLGRNCSELKELLKQALTSKQQVTAVTRHQPKLENEEKLLDQVADSNWEEGNFPFPTEFEPLEKFQTKKIILKSRNCKRVDNLVAFSESCQEIKRDRDHLADEQKVDDSLQSAWKEEEDRDNDEFDVRDGFVYKIESRQGPVTRTRLAVPQQRRQVLLKLAHSSTWAAHLGRRKALERLTALFLARYDSRCEETNSGVCRLSKRQDRESSTSEFAHYHNTLSKDSYGCCLSISCNCKENRYILTHMDMATRFPEAIPLRRVDAESVVEAMIKFFNFVGFPQERLIDRGTNFTSCLMQEVSKRLGIERLFTSPYHSQSNGMLERWHSTMKAMLRKSGKGRTEWDLLLPTVCFAYREALHEATGFSPFQLVYGREVRGPLQLARE